MGQRPVLLTAAKSVVAFAPIVARTTAASAYHFFICGTPFNQDQVNQDQVNKIRLNPVAAYTVKRILRSGALFLIS